MIRPGSDAALESAAPGCPTWLVDVHRIVVEPSFPKLDEILDAFRAQIGTDFDGYRNHCTRMLQFCFALRPTSDEDRTKCIIASAFHDIGIWLADTVDYIPPSIPPAQAYLVQNDLAGWTEEVTLLISEHHKVRPYTDPKYPLVEQFRQADLIDFSLGAIRFGLPASFVSEVKERFPNAGFHKMLVGRASAWFMRHPLNPAPMMKW